MEGIDPLVPQISFIKATRGHYPNLPIGVFNFFDDRVVLMAVDVGG